MADAKIIIEAISDNTGIKDLTNALGDAQQKLKETQKQLKAAEKAGNLTDAQMKALRAEFNQQKLIVSQLNGELKRTASGLTQTGEKASDLKNQLKGMISDKLGIDLDSIAGKFTSTNAAMLAVASAAAAMSAALISSARELSSYSNQFIAFAGNAKHAKDIYDEFNAVYRNTNYDEQAVYNLGKSFMSLGMNAKDAAALVMECADASASVGKGVEFADELANAFKRLYTGGELTERQFKSLAEAGIDLSDVQDQMREGGLVAYEALKEKLREYEGGMSRAKQTAAEMEGDIKGNLVEIGRQTANLVDEFFGFSEALREFYQWVINASQAAIDSIKGMVSALHNARSAGNAYAEASKDWENLYGEIWEEKRKEYASEEDWERDRAAAIAAYANATADVVVEAENRKQEAIEETKELSRHQVESIAKTSGSTGGGSGGGRDTSEADAKREAAEKAKAEKKLQQEIAKIAQETIRVTEQQYQAEQKGIEIANKRAQIGERGLELEKLKYEQDMKSYDEQLRRTKELSDAKIKAIQDVKAATEQAIADGVAPDGSQAKIDKLNEEIKALKDLGAQQIKNIEDEKAARQEEYNDNSGLINDDPGANVSVDDFNGMSAALDAIKAKWSEFTKLIQADSPQLKMAFNVVAQPFANMCESIINGTKSAGEAMKDFVKQMITAALNMLMQWTTIFALITAFTGNPKKGADAATKMVLGLRDGGMVKAASGGYISGGGSNRSDSIPAMLSNGEFVLNANAVNAVGADNLARINAAGSAADGMAGIGSNVTLNISAVDASGFGDFLARGGLQAIKQALYNDDRSFGAATVW